MRVALLTYNARLGDAIGQSVADKLAFFLDHHAEVQVVLEDDRQMHPLVRPHGRRVDSAEELAEELKQTDLVIAEFGHYYPLLSVLPALAESKPRIVIDYHGVTPPELWGPGQRDELERGLRHRGLVWCADAVLVHSQFTLRELRDQLGYPEERLHQIGFSLDLQHFSPASNSEPGTTVPGLVEVNRGLSSPARKLLFVGRLAPNKRVPLLIEALAQLRSVAHLLIAGNDGELYQAEAEACQRLAQEHGVAERVHFLGQQTGTALRDLYRSADVLVHPSRWETFCLPIVEAMACGLPVVAARTTALPETIGDAGLTFTPDDVNDLVRQVDRVLDASPPRARNRKAAIVAFRFGTDFVGGAETSLRTMARALQAAGIQVEVFTTCVRSESDWRDELPEGDSVIDGMLVHRFRIDPHDRPRHLDSVRRIQEAKGAVPVENAREYLRHSIHSSALIEELKRRGDEFDAVVVGPYLFGLTADVAQVMGEKTLLVPCFHDEPFARLSIWPEVYANVGGLLWHSAEEQRFAEVDLGFNHPRSCIIGTLIKSRDRKGAGDAARSHSVAALKDVRHLVYCGRYSPEKELPRLLEYFERYEERRPGRFKLACVGQGPLLPPRVPWLVDLGFVDERRKEEILAGADALVQLSRFESLSLVALEAWALGTPVIADAACAVLAGHVQRSQGGATIGDFEAFARVLDDLWENPEYWLQRGLSGQTYVQEHYGSATDYAARLLTALEELGEPLSKCMRRRGLERAQRFDQATWRQQFGRLIEATLEAEAWPRRLDVEVQVRSSELHAAPGGFLLLPVKIANQGTLPLWPEGPARSVLRASVVGVSEATCVTLLPGPLTPGQALNAVARLPAPKKPGEYIAEVCIERNGVSTPPNRVRLVVGIDQGGSHNASLTGAQAALAEAHRLQQLPDDYHDVTQGALAGLKRGIKRKLLGNFKHAYVDVLSRQQSACNEQLVRAVSELAECCATLDHAVQLMNDEIRRLKARLRRRKKKLASGGREAPDCANHQRAHAPRSPLQESEPS